jgi:hypothetical protein
MSTTNPWSSIADIVRLGIDGFVTTQKAMLDIAAQQNAIFFDAIQGGFGASAPAVADLAGKSTKAFLASQSSLLDLAVQQNTMTLDFMKTKLGGPTRPYLNELAAFLEQGTRTFVDAHKRLLEFAGQQADAMMTATREANGGAAPANPLAQMAELSRQAVDAFIGAQKKFLEMMAQQAAAAGERVKTAAQPSAAPANDILNTARQSFQSYIDLQRQFTEAATRQMSDWTRAWQTGAVYQPPVTLPDLARQGVEAFINTQRAILDLTFRSISR